jgi:hypothetical protein
MFSKKLSWIKKVLFSNKIYNIILFIIIYIMSSLSFLGNATSYLRIPNTDEFDFGTGDFTIEWYQYQRDSNPFPRIFQVGKYVGGTEISIGVSIEGGTFYYWTNNTFNLVTTLLSSNYKNKWVHNIHLALLKLV